MRANRFALCYGPISSHRVNVQGATTGISRIMSYLDGKSRATCRLVCRTWKQLIDDEIGLRVKLNENKYAKANGVFCRSVLVERLTVEHLDKFSNFVVLKFPDELRMLNCIGPVDPLWFKGRLLTKCRHLVRIELSGAFLQSQSLVTPSGGFVISNGIISVNRHVEQNTRADAPHITFPHLKSLIISYTHGDVEAYQSKVNGSGTVKAILGTIFGRRFQSMYLLKQRIDSNVSYILSTIRSLSLRTLYVSVDGMYLDEDKAQPTWVYTWKQDPLKYFLEAHRPSLRRLYLPHYNGDTRADERTLPIFPCNLSTLEVSLLQKGDRKNSLFMEKLLLVQTELTELRFEKHYVGHGLTEFPSLVSAIKANERTLTFVHLTLSPSDREFMDGHIFTPCKSLRTLIIERAHDGVSFQSVTKLPESLRDLRIHATVLLLPCEYMKYKRFSKLETLILDDVLLQSTGHCKRLEMIRLIQNVLHMRRLHHLHLDTREEDCGTEACAVVNSLLQALHGNDGTLLSTANPPFSSIQIKSPRRDVLEEESRHFLNSDPLYRTEVDPTKKLRVPTHFEEIFSVALDQVIVTSNVFKELTSAEAESSSSAANDDGPEEGEPWCDFCYGLFTAAEWAT